MQNANGSKTVNTSDKYFAHSARGDAPWEPLPEHLINVSRRAAEFASVFGAEDEGAAVGLLHDAAKYGDLFVRRLQGKIHGLDHWSLGAYLALTHYKQHGVATALAIQGHHIGLQRGSQRALRELSPEKLNSRASHPLGLELTEPDPQVIMSRFSADRLELPPFAKSIADLSAPHITFLIAVRMLFSALVDADFLETRGRVDSNSGPLAGSCSGWRTTSLRVECLLTRRLRMRQG